MQPKCTNVNSFRIIIKTFMLLVLIFNFNAAIIVQTTGCNRDCEFTYTLRPWEFSKPKPVKPIYPPIRQRVVYWSPFINYQIPPIFTKPIQPTPINNEVKPVFIPKEIIPIAKIPETNPIYQNPIITTPVPTPTSAPETKTVSVPETKTPTPIQAPQTKLIYQTPIKAPTPISEINISTPISAPETKPVNQKPILVPTPSSQVQVPKLVEQIPSISQKIEILKPEDIANPSELTQTQKNVDYQPQNTQLIPIKQQVDSVPLPSVSSPSQSPNLNPTLINPTNTPVPVLSPTPTANIEVPQIPSIVEKVDALKIEDIIPPNDQNTSPDVGQQKSTAVDPNAKSKQWKKYVAPKVSYQIRKVSP